MGCGTTHAGMRAPARRVRCRASGRRCLLRRCSAGGALRTPCLLYHPPPPAEVRSTPCAKKRNFIVVNDMEIELDDDDDDDEEEQAQTPADTALSETRIPSCALGEDAQEGMATPHASPVRA